MSVCRISSGLAASARSLGIPSSSMNRSVPRNSRACAHPRGRNLSVRVQVMQDDDVGAVVRNIADMVVSGRKIRRLPSDWMSETVEKLVSEAGERPSLHCVNATMGGLQHKTFGVDKAVVRVPELWSCIAEHLNEVQPDALLMVQKITHLSQAQNMPRPGREPQRSGTPALITGETGDCCEDDYPHRSIVFDEDNQVFRDMYRQLLEGPMHPDTSTQYYGVVVQARETSSGALGGAAASGSGCYLLKITTSTAANCRCKHYSFVRLTEGQPLEHQQWRPFLLA